MTRFADPWFLLLLPGLGALVYLYLRRQKGGRGSIRYSDISRLRGIPQSAAVRLRHSVFVLRMAVLALLVLALARPQQGRRESEIITRGVDIILCLDISSSMTAEDFKPQNRFQAAKQVMKDFIHNRKNDRIGMVVFSAESFTQCPLTLDYGVLLEFVDKVQIGMIEDGTAIGNAIATCVNRLRDSAAKSKVVILLTDGENNRGEVDPVTAAKAASAMGVKIYTVGAGKEGGAPIPYTHPLFGKQYLRNPDGTLYLTRIDEASLQEIARITGARYYRATNTKKLQEIYHEIGELEKTRIKTKEYMNFDERFFVFLAAALGLLVLEIVLANTRFRKIP